MKGIFYLITIAVACQGIYREQHQTNRVGCLGNLFLDEHSVSVR